MGESELSVRKVLTLATEHLTEMNLPLRHWLFPSRGLLGTKRPGRPLFLPSTAHLR